MTQYSFKSLNVCRKYLLYLFTKRLFLSKLSVSFVLLAVIILQEVVAEEIEIDTVLLTYQQEAIKNNPGLKFHHYNYLAEKEKVPQSRKLPDPELSATYFPEPLQYRMGDHVASAGLMQMFPWFGTRKLLKEAAEFSASASLRNYEDAANLLQFQVAETYFELQAIEEIQQSTESNLAILESLMQTLMSRFETAKASMADVLLLETEIDILKDRLRNIEDDKIALNSRFASLLNKSLDDTIVLADTMLVLSLPTFYNDYKDSLILENAKIKKLEYEQKQFESQAAQARKSGMPSIGLGAEYMFMQGIDGMGHDNMIMPMLSIKLPIQRSVYNARKQEAQYRQEAVEFLKFDLHNRLNNEWEETAAKYRDAQRRIDLYQTQTERMELALRIIIEAYASGGKSFEDVLNIQKRLVDFELSLTEAKKENNLSIAGMRYLLNKSTIDQ